MPTMPDIEALADEVRALADRIEALSLDLLEALPEPDARQTQALSLVADAGQYLFAASINLRLDGAPIEECVEIGHRIVWGLGPS